MDADGIAVIRRALGQRTAARFVTKLPVTRKLERDQCVHRARLAQFGVLDGPK